MEERPCPVCGETNSTVIMQFTPELLAAVNTTYRLEVLERALAGSLAHLTYSRCQSCGMVYNDHCWDNSVLAAVYGESIDHEQSGYKTQQIDRRLALLRTWNNILRIVKLNGRTHLDGFKLIDYGCGWGDFLDTVWGNGVDVVGFDQDEIKTSRPLERGHNICASVDDLVAFGPVDVFVMNSVLEHLLNLDDIFSLVQRVLKPKGLLVFSVMDYRRGFIDKNAKLLGEGKPAMTKNLNPVEHVSVYDYKSCMETLRHRGFDFVSTGASLYATDFYWIRHRIGLLRMINDIERFAAKIISGKELSIEVYATKR